MASGLRFHQKKSLKGPRKAQRFKLPLAMHVSVRPSDCSMSSADCVAFLSDPRQLVILLHIRMTIYLKALIPGFIGRQLKESDRRNDKV